MKFSIVRYEGHSPLTSVERVDNEADYYRYFQQWKFQLQHIIKKKSSVDIERRNTLFSLHSGTSKFKLINRLTFAMLTSHLIIIPIKIHNSHDLISPVTIPGQYHKRIIRARRPQRKRKKNEGEIST